MTRWRRTSTRCAAPLTSSIERFFLETEDRWSLIRSRLCTCSNDHLFAIKLRRNLHPLVPCMFNIQTRTREAWTLTQGMHGAASSDAESRRLTPLRLSLKAASSPPLPTPHAYSTFQDSRCVKSLAIGSVPRAPTMGGRLHCGLEVYTQSALSRDKGNRAGPTATNSAQTHKYHKFHKHRLRTVTVAQPMVTKAMSVRARYASPVMPGN